MIAQVTGFLLLRQETWIESLGSWRPDSAQLSPGQCGHLRSEPVDLLLSHSRSLSPLEEIEKKR